MRAKFIKAFILAILLFSAAVFFLPLLIVLTNSFMSSFEVLNRYSLRIIPSNDFGTNGVIHFVEFGVIPRMATFSQYDALLFQTRVYIGYFYNSLKLVTPIVAGHLLIAIPAAYAFEVSSFKFKEAVFFIYIVIMLLPLQVTLVPNFIIAEFLNINGSYLAIILPAIFNPFGVFLVRQYLKGFPREYIEAAKLDGAGHFRILKSVTLPLVMPAVAALTILIFIDYWNVVDQTVIFIHDSTKKPMSVYLAYLAKDIDIGVAFAASCFYMLPAVIVFLFGQDYMVEGIQLSGLK
ncbi:MAG: carbohydrate ABC transporter permease [Lachnospiraceae bacterium]|nr:carbohydrate ABC transporter permease [Lachnospiraceae bacterium]